MRQNKFEPVKGIKLNKSLLVMAIVSALSVGCGSSDDNPPASSSLSGSVAKGIVKNGTVTAYILSEDGSKGASVGTATTGNDGSYTLTMADGYDGASPLLLELTATDKTTMVCDARDGCGTTPHGGDIPLADTGFTLTAAIPTVKSGAKVDAAITAFTNMAASSIVDKGGISDSSILATNSQVSQIAGVNILSTSPVNIASNAELSAASTEEQRYAIMLAALASQAFTDTGSDGVTVSDMITNLDSFNNDFTADGDIGDEGGLSPSDLYTAATSEIETIKDSISSEAVTETTQLISVMEGQIQDGTLAPQESSGENPTEVAQAKALVSEVRGWATALQDLENPASVFLDEAGTITDTLDTNSAAVLEVYAMALSAAANAIAHSVDTKTSVPATVNVKNGDSQIIGAVNITDNSTDTAREYVISGSDLAGVTLNTTLSLNVDPTATTFAAGDVILDVNGKASNSGVSIELSNAKFTATLAEALNTSANGEPVLGAAALQGSLAVTSLNSGVATSKKITANAEIKYVTLDSSIGGSLANDMNMTLEKIALNDLTVSNANGETAGLSVSLNVNNAASFDTLSYLNAQPVMYVGLDSNTDPEDFDFTKAREKFGISTLTQFHYNRYMTYVNGVPMKSSQSCAEGKDNSGNNVAYSCVDGDLIGINEQVKGMYPSYVKNVDVQNFYLHNDTGGWVKLTLDDMETAESFLDATLNISGSINLEGKDEATLAITANKTGLKAGNMTATLGYSGKNLQLSASTTNGNEDGTTASLSFKNADDVSMTMSNSEGWTSGKVMVGEAQVGTIENQDGLAIIRYNDGTFESL